MATRLAGLLAALAVFEADVLNIAAIVSANPIPPLDLTPVSLVLDQHTLSMVVDLPNATLVARVENAAGDALSLADAPVTFTSDLIDVATVDADTGVVTAVSATHTVGADDFARSDSATSMGTATTGGAWTSQGASPWGLTSGKGYNTQTGSGGVTQIATQTYSVGPTALSQNFSTDAIDGHVIGIVPRFVDNNNYISVGVVGGAVKLTVKVGGTANTRINIAQGSTGLPATGSASGTLGVTLDTLGNLAIYLGGTVVPGATYTLSSGEAAALLSATKAGVQNQHVTTTTTTASTFDSWLATVPGVATITATVAGTITDTCVVTVSPDLVPANITMTPDVLSLTVGGSDTNVSSTVTNATGLVLGTATVAYESSDTSVFTVGASSGVVHPVGVGNAILTATSGTVFDTTAVSVTASTGARSLIFPHARFRIIKRWSGATDDAFANAHFSDIHDTSSTGTLSNHPAALTVQCYSLLLYVEANFTNGWNGTSWNPPTDDANSSVIWVDFAANYAAANGEDEEDYWLHAQSGQHNNVTDIWSIAGDGTVVFNKYIGSGTQLSSFPFSVGQSVTLSGLTAGNGTYTISALQKNGVTLTGWSSGVLGSGTVGTGRIGQMFTLGDGTKTKANRYSRWGWATWTMGTCFATANARAMQIARYQQMLKGVRNCAFIDSMATGDYNAHTVSLEYGSAQPAPQYVTDVATTLAGILTAGPGAPQYLRINLGGYNFPNDTTLARAAQGVHDETALTLVPYDQSTLDYVTARINEGIDIEYSNGALWTVTGGVGTMTGLPGSYNVGNYATTTGRAQMSLYCLYLMAVDATFTAPDGGTRKHAIFDITNGFSASPPQGPLSAMWQKGFEYNIGQPTGAKTQLQRTDASGQAIRTLTRTFSLDGGATTSAVVIYNHNVNGQSNYGDNSLTTSTLPTPPAGKAWYLLGADGTFSTATYTTIGVRRSEGVILVALDAGTLAQRADTFVDSIGSNIHMDASPYNAHFPDLVIPAVADMGMRTIRSGCFGSSASPPIALTKFLADETGARFILVTNQGASFSDMSIQDNMLAKIDPAIVAYLEGPNEVDNNNSAWGGIGTGGPTGGGYGQNVTTFMAALKADISGNANTTVRSIPISTPTVTSAFGASKGADWSGYASVGAAHPYPGASEPGAPLAAALAAVKPIMASLTSVIVTETGYETAPNATSPSYLIGSGISETAHAKYMPRLYAEYFKQGVVRTSTYELFDDGSDATNGEANFGIVKSNGTTKAAYTSLKNLIAILRERTWTPNAYALGTAYVTDTFTRTNQTGWGTATSGADTSKTWADGDGNETGHWSISGNHGVATATSQIRNIVGDSHSGGQEVYVEFRNVRASYSQLLRTYVRYTDVTHNYSFDFNPGVSNQVSWTRNQSTNLASGSAAKYALLTAPNVRVRVRTVGSDVWLYARVWDSALTEPTTWDSIAIDFGAASGLLAGKCGVWVDNNNSGGQVYLTKFTSTPVTTTAGSWPALSALTLGRLQYTLSGSTTNVQDLLLQKSDGSFWLLLWQRVSSWNAGSKADITNATASVTITTPTTHDWHSYTPSTGTSATTLATGATSVTVAVPDELLLVKIS